jgi:hypothetical protein
VLVHIPSRCNECGEQAARKHSPGLQRVDTENLPHMRGVVAPLIDDVKNLRTNNPTEHNQNAEIPSVIPVIAEALGIADTDPQTQEDAK